MIQKHVIKFQASKGGTKMVALAANDMAAKPGWPRCAGIKAKDRRVLWTISDACITFYYREER